jgi:putative acetyltransferase
MAMAVNHQIRTIQPQDNATVEYIIRYCLTEFGANHEGTAWADPNLGHFYELYQEKGRKYWVAENEAGQVVAGVGIGPLPGTDDVCELQKMYCLPEARGVGIAYELLQLALKFAREHYRKCYLETLGNMTVAQRFYEKHGFIRIYEPVGTTGHYACDVLYIKDL